MWSGSVELPTLSQAVYQTSASSVNPLSVNRTCCPGQMAVLSSAYVPASDEVDQPWFRRVGRNLSGP